MCNEIVQTLQKYLKDSYEELVELTFTLCEIPAPSGQEKARAVFCENWLKEHGVQGAYIDPLQNVIWPYKDDGNGKLVVIAAHTDTVFTDTEPFKVRMEENRAYCPGIGDDTISVAMLLLLMNYMQHYTPKTETGMLFVLDTNEEGNGHLAGIRRVFEDYGDRIREFISLDGVAGLFCTESVGYVHYRISIDAKGGHAFGAFGTPNAIAQMAELIHRLYTEPLPKIPGVVITYNVGMIQGGSAVNAIAQHAEILYEYRSNTLEGLEQMRKRLEQITEEMKKENVNLKMERIGDCPCSVPIAPERLKPLIQRGQNAIFQAFGFQAELCPGASDCSVPLSMGIPALLFGTRTGEYAHSYGEYYQMDKLPNAYEANARLLNSYFIIDNQ